MRMRMLMIMIRRPLKASSARNKQQNSFFILHSSFFNEPFPFPFPFPIPIPFPVPNPNPIPISIPIVDC